MNFSKYGFDGLSQCFLQFTRWLMYFCSTFFQNIFQMILLNIYSISAKNKITNMKHNEHNWWTHPNS